MSCKMDANNENNSKIANLEEQRNELEHQAFILKEMLSTRQRIQLALREKQINLNEELQQKKERMARLSKEN